MSKIFVYINTINERINLFAIGYIINRTLHIIKVFRDQVEKCLRATFYQHTMEGIRNFMRKKDTCVIAIVMFYYTKNNSRKVYRVLSCVLYSVVDNYVCI